MNWETTFAVPTSFINGDRTSFNNSNALPNLTINVAGSNLSVAEMIVNGTNNYTFNGNGIKATQIGTTIAGATGKLIKSNTGTLTLNNANEFEGGIDFSGGTIVVGNDLAFGTWQNSDPFLIKQGMLTVKQSGSGTIKIESNRNVKNRFHVEPGGALTFNIASGRTYTIDGLVNGATANNYGGVISSYGGGTLRFEGGGNLQLTGNTAYHGGAISMLSTTYAVSLDFTNLGSVEFMNNHATGYGGAIYVATDNASTNVVISGSTNFNNNSSQLGGAIYMESSGGTLELNTSNGDIVFSGNQVNGVANSIHLAKGSQLLITGNHDVIFTDPISSGNSGGNSLTMSGTGTVEFAGASFLNLGTDGGAVNINNGVFYLVNGANFTTIGNNALFSLGKNATLSGSGNISATKGSHLQGTVSLTGATKIGTMRFDKTINLDGAKLIIDIDSGNVSDKIILDSGNVDFGAVNRNHIDLQDYIEGTYNLIEVSGLGNSISNISGKFDAVTVKNKPLVGRQMAELQRTSNNKILQLILKSKNIDLVWTGGANGNWDVVTTGNWINSVPEAELFMKYDHVTFNNISSSRAVNVDSGGVEVSGMKVEGGAAYTFSGGDISILESTQTGQTVTGQLQVNGSGTKATFNNNLTATKGITIGTGATVELKGSTISDMNIVDNGTLIFNRTSTSDYTFGGTISGSGNFVKDGNNTLTLTTENTFTGGTVINNGTIILENDKALGTWTGNPLTEHAGTVTVSKPSSSGTIKLNDDRNLKNRFIVDRAGTLTFDIGSGNLLAIDGVINTITPGFGGAFDIEDGTLAFGTGGNLVVSDNKAAYGGGISIVNSLFGATFDSSSLDSFTLTDNTATDRGGAVYAEGNNATVTLGSDSLIYNNAATFDSGGAFYIESLNETTVGFGTNTYFGNNIAGASGGAIYAEGIKTTVTSGQNAIISENIAMLGSGGAFYLQSQNENTVVLGKNTYFQDNVAGKSGGAIYASSTSGATNITVAGNTFFDSNIAGTSGGAVYADSGTAGKISLDTTDGHIAFHGNGNSIHMEKNMALEVTGGNNVYFNDAISSGIGGDNSFTMDGTGIVQFVGDSVLNAGGTGGKVEINSGTFRLVTGGNFSTSGDAATFTLASGATLSGGGMIEAEEGFTFNGTISLDNATLNIPDWNPTTNRFGIADIGIPDADKIGEITLVGNANFDGAKLRIDLAPGGIADKIIIKKDISFGAINQVDLNNFIAGTFNLIKIDGIIPTNILDRFPTVTLRGNNIDVVGRRKAELQLNGDILQLVNSLRNIDIIWTGAIDAEWDTSTKNWLDTVMPIPNIETFISGDRVTFDATGANKTIRVLATGVGVADMIVTGADDYTFSGGSIIGKASAAGETSLTDATGKLKKSDSGILTFNNANEFDGGIEFDGTQNNGTIVLGHVDSYLRGKSLGTWTAGDPTTSKKGMVSVHGAGNQGTIRVNDSQIITNRFDVDQGGKLTFEIATDEYLTIHEVENTASDGIGGAIRSGDQSEILFSSGGNFVLLDNKAGFGGGIGMKNDSGAVSLDFAPLKSVQLSTNTAENSGGAVYAVGKTTNVTLGEDAFVSENTATSGSGGAFHLQSQNASRVDLGENLYFWKNTAATDGGGVYLTGSDTSVALSEKTFIGENVATSGSGGAIYANSTSGATNIDVFGNTFFENNTAGTSGGAIYANGVTAGTISLNTDNGHIAFSGNTAGGSANSIHMEKNMALTITGNNNVYFNDAISSGTGGGNSFTMNGSGIVQFVGDSSLNAGTPGGAVNINDGTFRLVTGGNFTTSGDDAAFTLANGATLSGAGTINAPKGFTLNGTISLDSATLAVPNWNPATSSFGTADIDIPDANEIGTVTLVGDTKLSKATLDVDLTTGNVSDKIVIQGGISFVVNNNNKVNISTFEIGTFDIITTTGTMPTDILDYFDSVTVGGLTPQGRQQAKLQKTGNILQLVTSASNLDLTWVGANGNWDTTTTGNWIHNSQNEEFIANDYVIFDGTGNTRNILVAGGDTTKTVQVAGMEVGSSYDFSGGKIHGVAPTPNGQTVTGHLGISGAGTVVTFSNEVDFINGMTIGNGAKAQLNDDGSFSNMNIVNDGTLVFDRNNANTHAGNISGTGNFIKDGTGNVTLSGNNSYSGGTTIDDGSLIGTTSSLQGDIEIKSNATGVFDQNTDGTYAGRLTGAGTLIKDGTGTMTVTGDNSGFAGTVNVDGGTLVIDDGKQLNATSVIVNYNGGLLLKENATLDGLLTAVGNSKFQSEDGAKIIGNADFFGDVIVDGTLTVQGEIVFENGANYQASLIADFQQGEMASRIDADYITIEDGAKMTVNDTGVVSDYIRGQTIRFIVLEAKSGGILRL